MAALGILPIRNLIRAPLHSGGHYECEDVYCPWCHDKDQSVVSYGNGACQNAVEMGWTNWLKELGKDFGVFDLCKRCSARTATLRSLRSGGTGLPESLFMTSQIASNRETTRPSSQLHWPGWGVGCGFRFSFGAVCCFNTLHFLSGDPPL